MACDEMSCSDAYPRRGRGRRRSRRSRRVPGDGVPAGDGLADAGSRTRRAEAAWPAKADQKAAKRRKSDFPATPRR